MELDQFVSERKPRWDRFERLLDEVEMNPERNLDARTLQELVRLYRLACSDLNHARSITAQPLLLDRLNQLTGRGYRFVYRDARRLTLREAVVSLFLHEVPATFRRERVLIGAAAAAMLLGAAVGFSAVYSDPRLLNDLIPSMFQTESAKQRETRKPDEFLKSFMRSRVRTESIAATGTFHLLRAPTSRSTKRSLGSRALAAC